VKGTVGGVRFSRADALAAKTNKKSGRWDESKRKSTYLWRYNILIVDVFSSPQMACLAERRRRENHPIFFTAVPRETVEGNDAVAMCAELGLGRATPFSQAKAARQLQVGEHEPMRPVIGLVAGDMEEFVIQGNGGLDFWDRPSFAATGLERGAGGRSVGSAGHRRWIRGKHSEYLPLYMQETMAYPVCLKPPASSNQSPILLSSSQRFPHMVEPLHPLVLGT
jgi:hypothetical protein